MEDAEFKRWNYLLWAKSDPFKPLWMHLLETGIVAQELVSRGCFFPLGEELCAYLQMDESKTLALVGYIASVHDIGKVAGTFQAKDEKMKPVLEREGIFYDVSDFRHEDYGARQLKKIWKQKKRFSDREFRNRLGTVIRYHHQKTITRNAFRKDLKYEKIKNPLLENIQEKLENFLWEFFSPLDGKPLHMDAVCTLLLGIVVTADWIASGETFSELDVKRTPNQVAEDTTRLMTEFLEKNSMQHAEFPSRIRLFTDLWPNIPRRGMRPLQIVAESIMESAAECPLAVIMEAPMGEGKTEAGLFMAAKLAQRWGKEGFYVALPTAATSNQMHERVNGMLRSLALSKSKLMHGMAWVIDDTDEIEQTFYGESAREAVLWTAPMRRGMIAPFAVGTVDQAMMAAMRTKYGVLRLSGLTQKVLIMDELHAYDAYMGSIIKKLLSWCCALHIPVVMLSATLPAGKKREFAECYFTKHGTEALSDKSYPAITMFYTDRAPREIPVIGTHQRMSVHVETVQLLEQPEGIAALVEERIKSQGGCIGVILNTVKEAQRTYRSIKKKMKNDGRVLLFHARFSVARRNELEQECIHLLGRDKSSRPQHLVVVATQVVEQSLDLDFDAVISDLCPIDLLFQRAGRLWRHEETHRPVGMEFPCLTVLVPSDEDFKSSGIVYPPVLLERTWRAILEHDSFQIPEDIPELVDKIYADYMTDEQDMEHWIEYQMSNQMMESDAMIQELPLPSERRFWLEDGQAKNRDIFYSDEDTAFLPAKTRLGEVGIRFAILPKTMYDEIKHEEKISRSLARHVLEYSVTVPERKVRFLKESTFQDGERPLEGKGLLYGLWILAGDSGTCRFDDGHLLWMSDDMGLLIDEEIEGEED